VAQIRRAQGVAGLTVLTALAVLVAGCGLFEPRDPIGAGGPGVNCATPNSPENVVSNVVNHYAELAGVNCYSDMLDTAFTFHPDAADSIEALPDTVYNHWTRDIESRDASNVARDATFHLAAFDSEYAARVISADQRTQIRFYAYHLILHAPQASPDTLFRGLADITFFQGADAQWHITNWVDKRDGSGARTWGYLRRLYRIGF
jgi:hypothetical protein